MTGPVYLDCNATAPLRPEARDAVVEALERVGNASSVHGCGRAARRAIEGARREIAALCGAAPGEVVFTAGATEANATALAAAGRAAEGPLLASAIEHDSVLAWADERVPVTGDGILDLDALARRLAAGSRPRLLSVMAVNNETGAIQPVAEAAALARDRGVPVHCDAVQAAGRIPLDMAALGVDYLSLSSHKMGGPQGVGALAVRDGAALAPILRGGGQERRRRAGTENVAGIAGFGAAAEAAQTEGPADRQRLADLRDRLEAAVRAARPDARVLAEAAPRVANTSCLAMPGVPAETQVMAFDLAGIAVSAGSACSSGKVAASHVLAAMGVDPDIAGCAVRVSLGWHTRPQDIDRFVAVWQEMAARAGRPAAA
jgi:cysteine desulfurase